MHKVSTTLRRVNIASALYDKGIDSSVQFEVGRMAIKAMRDSIEESEAFNKANKLRAEEFNTKLGKEKAAFKGEEKDFNTSPELTAEREQLLRETTESLDKAYIFDLGDDKYKALLTVCSNSQKVWYKAMQEKNECTDATKSEKLKAPSSQEFNSFVEFVEDLDNAEKSKSKE